MYRYGSSTNQSVFRSYTSNPISLDQIARHAPSVLAPAAHSSCSDKYAYIPTSEVLAGLKKEGFEPYEVRQTVVRDASKKEFAKHLVRLRHIGEVGTQRDEAGEIVLINSHDGSSAYQLIAGFFRFVCSNGLIAGDITDSIKVPHRGNVVDNVIEGSYRVLDDIQLAEERIGEYKEIKLDRDEQHAFAKAALQLRWEENAAPISTGRVLNVRRFEDREPTLWNTFNSVQENMIKGGVSGHASTGRRMTTRGVSGVSENVKLNRALWTLADQMAKLKTAA
jgi:hypothetical protein